MAVPSMRAMLVQPDGSLIQVPTTEKKTPIVQPSIIPPGYYFYGTGAFDDVGAGTRGDGPQITLSASVATDPVTATLEGQFIEHVYIIGGYLASKTPEPDDWVSLHLKAPASTPEDRTGTGDGNANKVSVGPGANIIVPAPLNDGDWNVDGATLVAGELNDGLAPVPNADAAGYWHWDPEASPSIFPVADSSAPDGSYDLFDFDIVLARQANRYPCMQVGNVTPAAAIKGKKVLPHWVWVFTLYRKTTGSVHVAVRLDTARKATA